MPSTAERSGSFATENAILLLQDLAQEAFSGSVRAESGKLVKVLYLADGKLACASSTDPADRLGPLLRDAGQITAQQLEMAEEKALAGEALGSVLVNLGFIGPGDLMWGARRQVEKVVSSLLSWKEGEFRTRPSALPERAVNLKLSIPAMVIGAARLLHDRAEVTDRLGSLDTVLAPRQGATLPEDADRDTRDIWNLMDGERDLRSVCAESSLDDFETAKLVLGLQLLQLVEARAARRQEPSPPDRPMAGFAAEPAAYNADVMPPSTSDSRVDPTAPAATGEPAAASDDLQSAAGPAPPADEISARPAAGPQEEIFAVDDEFVGGESVEEVFAVRDDNEEDQGFVDRQATERTRPPIAAVAAAAEAEEAEEAEAQGLWEEADTTPADRDLLFEETTRDAPHQVDLSFPVPGDDEGAEAPTDSKTPPPAARQGGSGRTWMLGGGLILIAIISIYAWMERDDPQPLNTTIDRAPSVRSSSPEAATPALDQDGSALEPTPDSMPAPTRPVENPAPPPTRAAATPPPVQPSGRVETAIPDATLKRGAGYGEGLAAYRDGDFALAASLWSGSWASAHRDEFTLQVLVACETPTLARMARAVPADELFLLPVQISGRTCYRVGWGTYPSRDAALGAVDHVPAYFTATGDRPVPVALARLASS